MASTVAAYRNSDSASSGKSGAFLSRGSIETLFENCDLRPHHVNMLAAMWRAAGKPHGKEIFLFAAVEGYRIEARYKSRRSVQYNLRQLADPKVGAIELVHGANTIRRPATYRLRVEALGKRQTYTDFKNQRKAPHSVPRRPAPPNAPAPAAAPPTKFEEAARFLDAKRGHATPAPTPQPGGRPQRTRAPRRLTSREGPQLVARMAELMRGCKGRVNTSQGLIFVDEDDYRYREPLPQDKALIAACMSLGIAEDDAREHLKLCCWKFDEKP
jgi:hypothetical protein